MSKRSVKCVTLRYRPVLPVEVYDGIGALAENYLLQTKVLTKLSEHSSWSLNTQTSQSPKESAYIDSPTQNPNSPAELLPIKQEMYDISQMEDEDEQFEQVKVQQTTVQNTTKQVNPEENKFNDYMDEFDDIDDDLFLESELLSQTTAVNGLKIGEIVTLNADYIDNTQTFTVAEIVKILDTDASLQILAQRDSQIPVSDMKQMNV